MPQASSPPRVFISHASEDKDRFVVELAKKLRDNGVDAWLDKWEMMPGDRLVDKIFEEGIKNATALIVVLSKVSVTKPWVREELNAGFVKRVSGKCRLIPVVLDDCAVPECLQSTLWQRITNLTDYSEELQRILSSIFGVTDKPPIGASPGYADIHPLLDIPSLDKVDLMVLETLCDESVRAEDVLVVGLSCLDAVSATGITDEALGDSLNILDDEGYVELSGASGGTYKEFGITHLRIATHAFDAYAKAKWPNYDSLLTRLVSGLVNEKWHTKADLEVLDAPERLRDHLLRVLEEQGFVEISRYFGGYTIWKVSPRLKRALIDG
ncbi:MAG: toll/interleukin-1 receptor domain-containing protein [Planctomycetes bacterium]|nr:toll/interleukin-1 receptor domain-containing protein [Planctomycetota bacterium]